MSAFDREKSKLECELQEKLGEDPLPEEDALVDMALLAQAQVAYEELGDVLDDGTDFRKSCINKSGADVNRGGVLILSLNRCLANRYMGICQAADVCSGREAMEQRLARLGLLKVVNMDRIN